MVTHERLLELLSYDPESGSFTWLASASNRRKAGKIAGCKRADGYILVGIDGKLYTAHRLAWFYANGVWPDKIIDHINRNPSDNRLCNLRCVGREENSQNVGLRKNNKSGVTGVSFWKKRGLWQVRIKYGGKLRHVGYFETLDAATNARKEAERKHYPAKVFSEKKMEEELNGKRS